MYREGLRGCGIKNMNGEYEPPMGLFDDGTFQTEGKAGMCFQMRRSSECLMELKENLCVD